MVLRAGCLVLLLAVTASAQAGTERGRGARRNLRARGGNGLTENAIEHGLHWISRRQRQDGGWGDTGATARCVMVFLGAGYTSRGEPRENQFAKVVANGLKRLLALQTADGAIGKTDDPAFLRNHALATRALCEFYWMTTDAAYKQPAVEALDYLASARVPGSAWGATPRGKAADTGVTIACALALASAQGRGLGSDQATAADLKADPEAVEAARRYLARKRVADTLENAAGVLLARIRLGEDPKENLALRQLADRCRRNPPVRNPRADTLNAQYLRMATLALFQFGGHHWRDWNRDMKEQIVPKQAPRKDPESGSWAPIGQTSRLLSTASCVEMFESYYFYSRIFPPKRG